MIFVLTGAGVQDSVPTWSAYLFCVEEKFPILFDLETPTPQIQVSDERFTFLRTFCRILQNSPRDAETSGSRSTSKK